MSNNRSDYLRDLMFEFGVNINTPTIANFQAAKGNYIQLKQFCNTQIADYSNKIVEHSNKIVEYSNKIAKLQELYKLYEYRFPYEVSDSLFQMIPTISDIEQSTAAELPSNVQQPIEIESSEIESELESSNANMSSSSKADPSYYPSNNSAL